MIANVLVANASQCHVQSSRVAPKNADHDAVRKRLSIAVAMAPSAYLQPLSSTKTLRWAGVWEDSFVLTVLCSCEGDGDVVGVVTPLRGVVQVVLHGVQVVEVGVRLRVHQDRGVEEDGEGQVEVEREEGEVRERRSCVKMG